MNIYVYLHHPGQFYDSDSKTKIYVNQGKMLFIDLTYELSRVRVREHAVKPLHGLLKLSKSDTISGHSRRRGGPTMRLGHGPKI